MKPTTFFVIAFFLVLQAMIVLPYVLFHSGIDKLHIASCNDFWINQPFLKDMSELGNTSAFLGLIGLVFMLLDILMRKESHEL